MSTSQVEIMPPAETRRTIESKPVDLNMILYLMIAVVVAIGAVVLFLWFGVEMIRREFGGEGVRMVMVLAGAMLMFWLVNAVQSKTRRDNLHDLTEVQRVAVQSIIQHQRADDQGEVARMMPQVIKVLAQNQQRGQQLATEIARHGRWLADGEAKVARNARPELPFDINGDDDDMEEII